MSAIATVLLVTPDYHCGVVESAGRWPCLSFIYIGGHLRKAGFDPVYYDAMAKFESLDRIREVLAEVKPDVVLTTAVTATVNAAVEVLQAAKDLNPEVITAIGGVHATFCWENLLGQHPEAIDFCVLGEGEITVVELLQCLKAGDDPLKVPGIAMRCDGVAVRSAARAFVQDMDALTPAWDLPDWSDYPLYFIDDSRVAIVNTSRGCTHECSFCSQHKFWEGTYRERCPKAVVDEMELLRNEYGVNVFFVADEYPTRNQERWEELLRLLIERDLGTHILLETCVEDIVRDKHLMGTYREAGIMFIYLGVEALEQEGLMSLGKEGRVELSREAIQLVKESDMICESSLIVGMPDETPETIERGLELAKTYSPDYMHFLFMTPWPYADNYEALKPYIEEYDLSKYNLVEPIIKPKEMTRDDLLTQVLRCYREYYMAKLGEWAKMPAGFKKRCLVKGLKAIMENSFLHKHMAGLGAMPQEIAGAVTALLGKS